MKRYFTVLAISLCLVQQIFPRTQDSGAPKKLVNFGTTEFGTGDADIQFLPGGIIVIDEDGAKHQYAYHGQRFHRVPYNLPPDLKRWKSFDWEGVDILDQIDKQDFYPDIRKSLPGGSKVKKVLDVATNRSGRRLVLVCYSLPTTEKYPMTNNTDLFLVGMNMIKSTPYDKLTMLWTTKLKAAADYGNFTLQLDPNGGFLGVLYSASVGGNSVSRELDIWRIVP